MNQPSGINLRVRSWRIIIRTIGANTRARNRSRSKSKSNSLIIAKALSRINRRKRQRNPYLITGIRIPTTGRTTAGRIDWRREISTGSGSVSKIRRSIVETPRVIGFISVFIRVSDRRLVKIEVKNATAATAAVAGAAAATWLFVLLRFAGFFTPPSGHY